ncbi:MAG: hypothetical protein WCC55_06515 [Nitrosotalea sp.]
MNNNGKEGKVVQCVGMLLLGIAMLLLGISISTQGPMTFYNIL